MAELVGDGAVRVVEAAERGMIAVKGDLANEVLRQAACEAAGADFPGVCEAAAADDGGVLWMAPDEVLVVTVAGRRGEALKLLRRMAEGRHVLVEDVSDMRAGFVVEGDAMRDVLARVTPADVSPAGLPPGRLRRTRVGQVAAAIWLVGERRAEILCFQSVASYVRELLAEAAADEPLELHLR